MGTNKTVTLHKTMKFAQDSQDEGYVITAYERDSVSINGKVFNKSLIVTPSQLNDNWSINTVEQLTTDHIQLILAYNPELIIIGTGSKLIFPAIDTYAAIIKRGIGVDFMDTPAACRTYNILKSEDRNVVAGLIL
jgi:uncharacterized protein